VVATIARMRIAIVSDVHGNLVALEAVIADLRRQAPDLVLHGGDLAVNGPRPVEVVERVRELGWPGVRGNTDEIPFTPELEAEVRAGAPKISGWLDVLFGRLGPWAAERLGEERTSWLRGLPERRDEGDLRLVHASPRNLWQAPMPDADAAELERVYAPLGGSPVVYGHIHRPFVAEFDDLLVANSGSTGMPWDGDPRASYLLVDDGRPEVRRVGYDIDAARRDAHDAGFPLADWLGMVYERATFQQPRPESGNR
jgi:predicted phosphodiesterase